MSDSLRPHELQHARPPCPSPTPGVYSNSCSSSRWCHPAISSSVVPFSSCPHSLPASGSFPVSQLIRPYNSTSKYLPKRSKWRYMSTQDTCPYRHRNNLLGRKLGTSKRGGLAEKDASWSLNSIPDMPRRAHRYAAKITRDFSSSHTCTISTQWIQTNHRGFSNSSICAGDAQLCPQVTLGS